MILRKYMHVPVFREERYIGFRKLKGHGWLKLGWTVSNRVG